MKYRYRKMLMLIGGALMSLSVMAQDIKFSRSVALPQTVNSTAEESLPVFSPDGNTVYLTRTLHKDNTGGRFKGQDIWYAEKVDGKWGKLKNIGAPLNTMGNDAVVGIHKSGKRLYLLNAYEIYDNTISGLSYSDFVNGQWQKPVRMPIDGIYNRTGKNDIYGLHVNPEEDVLLISMDAHNSLGQEDLYVCFKYKGWNRFHKAGDEQETFWATPIHLGNVINSEGFEISPFLSADGMTLYFASSRKGGRGNSDIYYSKRLDNTWQNWSEPVNLGSEINSRQFEAYFTMTDSVTAYYASNKLSGRLSDILKTKLIPVVEKEEEEVVAVAKKPEVEEVPIPEEFVAKAPTAEEKEVEKVEEPELEPYPLDIAVDILFEFGSSEILLKYKEILDRLAYTLIHHPEVQLRLEGHTDHVGEHHENLELSHLRADAIHDYLVSHKIEESRFLKEGHGETKPKADNDTHHGRKQNRRVEIFFVVE